MKLIAYYAIYNEADFIIPSLKSVCPKADKTVIIEGAWKETYLVNGHKRSNDGTCKLVKQFIKDNPQFDIEYYELNEDTQLDQRTAVFRYLPRDEPYLLWLVDGDEVYEDAEANKVAFEAKKTTTIESRPFVWTFESLIFVNDFYNYSPVRYPRLFRIMPCESEADQYEFVQPNHIARNGNPLNQEKYTHDTDIRFFHYSYCHSPERFQEKKRERTRLHGNFAWELREGLVQRDDADIRPFEGEHPEVMRDHPLAGQRRHKQIKKPETVVYIEHSGIGNLILATPMLQAIRQAKPNAHIHVVCWKRTNRILEGADFVDTVIPADEHGQMSQLVLGDNKIDHLLVSPVGAIAQLTSFLASRSKKIHRVTVNAPWTQHEAEVKMQLARRLGYRGLTPNCSIPYFEYNRVHAILSFPECIDDSGEQNAPTRWVAINAAYLKEEHWPKKHWGDQKFASLIDQLHEAFPELGFVFVGGDQDRGDAERIISYSNVPEGIVINRCGISSDIKDTVAILSGCVLCIGNDGGLQHIAAAVGRPTVTIFTFTNPVKNRPFYADLIEKCGKVVMLPCQKRLMCQHGNHGSCECLDVPTKPVFEAAHRVLQEVIDGGN